MKEDVRQAKEKEFREKLGQLQMTFAQLQKELAQEEAKLTKGIFERMARILAKMGEAEGFTMIFEKTESSILWAPRHLDLTNDLIRRYNAGEGKK
jgi:outer membrane protein